MHFGLAWVLYENLKQEMQVYNHSHSSKGKNSIHSLWCLDQTKGLNIYSGYIMSVINVTIISGNNELDSKVEYEKKKKSEGKMVRAERQLVLDMLFSAFEKHQYYNIKALVDITKQPVVSSMHARMHINTCKTGNMYTHSSMHTCNNITV